MPQYVMQCFFHRISLAVRKKLNSMFDLHSGAGFLRMVRVWLQDK